MNVFIFGGSFNPPHVAHVLAVAYVLATHDVDRVLVVPCFEHPFAKELAPFERRFEMCQLAMGFLPRTTISRVEQELGGESRTLRTVEHLQRLHPDWRLRLVVGADILLEGRRWHGFDRLNELAPMLVLGRAGLRAEGAPRPLLPEVSSSAIRQAIHAGRPSEVAALVPREVLAYIERHGVYR
ncbi:MAG TPA: nicotinate (nicotinamide) nucleotide adenylyltransferase [Polyangiaceae bacterium]|nr:nicotinate (nicotinamide) nucleotide adenylyltransferase [Polyangiaceae bacterium]